MSKHITGLMAVLLCGNARLKAFMATMLLLVAVPSWAISIDMDDRGWYGGATSPGLHVATNQNTIMGGYRDGTNAFFIFDLAGLSGSMDSAVLELELENYNWLSAASVVVDVYQVLFDADIVDNSHAAGDPEGIAIHADLQDGPVFASATVTAGDVGSIVSFNFNLAGINQINSMLGDRIVFGIHTDTPYVNIGTSSAADWIRWSGGSESRHHILMTTVPEPTTLALLGIGLLGMGLTRRKKA